jgi:hypothetical protein
MTSFFNTKHFLFLMFFIFCKVAVSQIPSQTIRGQVSDKQSKAVLIGAVVVVADSGNTKVGSTDLNGTFRIDQVPIGRHTLKISYLGYRPLSIQVILNSGKELILSIELEEMVLLKKEIVVKADRQKDKANNEMTTVSARSFTIEESQRYAGSRNDPARMVANYAGVSGANDGRNDIIIRGNSPLGVLWRLNGIDIPSPNHFGTFGSTGGPISMLNNNVLDKSDFLTGAFPADYGNALAGVFDLKMRSGNNEKREYLAQLGLNGVELGMEGPFSKKSQASYLINYRYSTLDFFHTLGINLGTGSAIPKYQDVSFKIDVPTLHHGKFSLFGVGGKSKVDLLASQNDHSKPLLYNFGNRDEYFSANMGVIGASHLYLINSTTYSKLNVAISGTSNLIEEQLFIITPKNTLIFTPDYGNRSQQIKSSVNFSINKKYNARNTFTLGTNIDRYSLTFQDSVKTGPNPFVKLRDIKDKSAVLYQVYGLWQHRFSETVTLNSGLHYQLFDLNNSYALEPRIGVKWEFKENQSLSFGTGMHSQMQNILTYFDKTHLSNGSYIETNRNLGFTRSSHFVVAYDRSFGKDKRIKMEAYYQNTYKAPVTSRSSSYSLLNYGADFSNPAVDSLVNKGDGKNYGIELTLEKFYSKNYYFLFTTSLFESKYTPSDRIERNTAFNGNYTINLLGGKEFEINKKNTISFDLKTTTAGGRRYVPIDIAKTAKSPHGELVYDYAHAYENKLKDYFRLDVKLTYRRNGAKIAQEWIIDIQNVLNIKNVFTQSYNPKTNTYEYQYQLGIFPVAQYKILF